MFMPHPAAHTIPALDELSLLEIAGQLVMPRLGSWQDGGTTVEEAALAFEALLEEIPVGGALLFNGHVATTPSVLKRLQEKSRVPLLISSDMERGAGQQIRGATLFPHAMACGMAEATADGQVGLLARITAREALSCGVQMLLAPVADVDRHPDNPIIATRAFGHRPADVANHVRAYLSAAHTEGILTVTKHFPGHGGTAHDSHEAEPFVADDRDILEATDLVPFRKAVELQTAGLMTAHVSYASLDPEERPATVSPPVLSLARTSLGFDGLLMSDSLQMAGLTRRYPDAGTQAVACVAAGVDVLLDPPDPVAAVRGLRAAVEDGRLPEAHLREAAARVLAAKLKLVERFGRVVFDAPESVYGLERVGSQKHRGQAAIIARNAVTAVPKTYTSSAPSTLAVIVLAADPSFDLRDSALEEAFTAFVPACTIVRVPRSPDHANRQLVRETAASAERVCAVVVEQPAAWQQSRLSAAQEGLLRDLGENHALWLGVLGRRVPDLEAEVCLTVYSDVPASQRALVDALRTRCTLAPASTTPPSQRHATS